jgi:hypothetical protein
MWDCRDSSDLARRIYELEIELDGYRNFTWPNGETEDAAVAACRLQEELEQAVLTIVALRDELDRMTRDRDFWYGLARGETEA